MIYSVQLLKTAADCDSLITMATQDSADLGVKKYVQERKLANSGNSSVGIDADIAAANAEIGVLETLVAGMPEGDIRKGYESKLTKAKYKLFTLIERRNTFGQLSILRQQYDLGQLEKDIAEVDLFITAINARKAAL